MSTWKEFYSAIRDSQWPECDREEDFKLLPESIQQECINDFGYAPGSFKNKSKLPNRRFPIVTDTACQLKWNFSTIFLTTETTASCHRTNHHKFDSDFNFHNTSSKIYDRKKRKHYQRPQNQTYC